MMMMIGDPPRSNPTVQIPQHDYYPYEDPTAHNTHSPNISNAYAALNRYLPSNNTHETDDLDFIDDFDVPVDAFSCDNFRMFDFKVKKCSRARSHDWTECPFAHPGEKARRRDPRKHHYSGNACPDFRKGACTRGDSCEYAHGVFECWLHPARYRTQPCKDGTHCRRRVCFFAHTPDQLRVLPGSPDGSPTRPGFDPVMMYGYSPPSSPTTASPPEDGSFRLCQLAESMRAMQISKVKMGLGLGLSVSPPGWKMGFGSPRSPIAARPGFMSLPSTPVRVTRSGLRGFDSWEPGFEEEPVMERVESGRELRERIYAKIGKENALDRVGRVDPDPDVGWVSELVN